MKAKLAAGTEIDIVSPGELRQILGEFAASRQDRRGPTTAYPRGGVSLDGSGNANSGRAGDSLILYEVPLGYEFALHRLFLDVEAAGTVYTPASPFTNNSGYAEVHARGNRVDFVNFSTGAGGLPALREWSSAQAPRITNGERLTVLVWGGPASGQILARAQGTLRPATTE